MRRAVADYVRDKDTGVIKIPRDVIESAENVRIVVGEEELIESKETFSGGIAGADFLDWIENSKALDVDGGRIREFIRLRFVDGFTLKEIGDRWGMSFQTVSRIAVGYLETLEALGGLA